VEAEPGPEGLDVVFRPIPAPRLLSVRVEGTRVISVGDLERIARLRPRETLWPVRLERAARDVALTLASRGYLEAQVTGSVRRSPGGADAVFTVRAGPELGAGAVFQARSGEPLAWSTAALAGVQASLSVRIGQQTALTLSGHLLGEVLRQDGEIALRPLPSAFLGLSLWQ